MTTYHVRVARDDDVDAVLALRRHAEDWLKEAGIEQWTRSAHGTRVIKDWIGAGSTFVITTDDGEIIGSLSLDAGDPDFWTDKELREPALYLYKFIIRSDHRVPASAMSCWTGPATASNSQETSGSASTAGATTPASTSTT